MILVKEKDYYSFKTKLISAFNRAQHLESFNKKQRKEREYKRSYITKLSNMKAYLLYNLIFFSLQKTKRLQIYKT